jgi:fumarate reductase subunit D
MSETSAGPAAVRANAVPLAFAAVAFLLLLVPGLVGPYGPFIDELYYVSCSERLAWGYVDHPPLAPALLRVARILLGDGLAALRIPIAAGGALLMFGVAILARRLGAGPTGQALACAALLTAPLYQIMFGFYSMNALEILMWAGLLWVLVEIERRDAGHLWLLFGAIAGVALMAKHTVVLLALALGVGLLATPARRHFKDRRLWLGALLAAVLVAPNLAWQVAHDWPSLEFYRNAALEKQVRMPPLQVLATQLIFVSPGTLPLWLGGLALLWRRELRHLAVLYIALLTFMVLGHESRPDRIAGVYPLLFAAGGAWWESRLASGRSWPRAALVAWLAAWGAILAPLGLPILPPDVTARWAATLGVVPQIERGAGKRTELPQWFADRFGWEELVQDVAAVRSQLSADERPRAVYFAPSYGQAGALEWLGRDRGLTPVYSTHNSFFLWGPPPDPVEVAIVLGNRRERLEALFGEVTLARVHDCDFCMPWRDQMPIWIGRRPLVRIADQWQGWKSFN